MKMCEKVRKNVNNYETMLPFSCSQNILKSTSRSTSRDFPGSTPTLPSLNKESRPCFLGDNSIWTFPSVSSLGDHSIWSCPEGYLSLAIIVFGASEFIVPTCYFRLGKKEIQSLDSLV